jgi:hypothetical protein
MDILSIKTSQDFDGRLVAKVLCDGGDRDDYNVEFRTSPSGSGLWQYHGRGEWRQVLGTGQFQAANKRQLRDGIRRAFENPYL